MVSGSSLLSLLIFRCRALQSALSSLSRCPSAILDIPCPKKSPDRATCRHRIGLDRGVIAPHLPIIPLGIDVFAALATPARRAILDELVERDGQTLFELWNRLAMKHQIGLTRQAISQHLDVLESAGLLTTVRQGKYKLHYLHTGPLRTIVKRWLKPDKKGKR